jgi:uncharacterized protein involved in exopolysaccharide biosynthesis
MKRFFRGNVERRFAVAVVAALGGWAAMAPASAAPPTVTPSPGYDARLQEQRAAPVIVEPAAPVSGPAIRRHARRRHGAH